MNAEKHIENLNALRDELKALDQTGPVRDALSRTTVLIGRVQLVVDEGKVADGAQADVEQQLETVAAKSKGGKTATANPSAN